MKAPMRIFGLLCGLSATCQLSAFNLTRLDSYSGFTIIGVKTIAAYVDEKGKRKDSFEGCNFGWAIVFSDGTYAKCTGYGYQYAYMPDALLLTKAGRLVMIVEDEAYEMSFQ